MLLYLNMDKVFFTLEIDKILLLLTNKIKSLSGKKIISNIQVLPNKEKLVYEYNKLAEMINVVRIYRDLPLSSNILVKETFEIAKKGSYLDEISLNELKNEVYLTFEIIKFFNKVDIDIPNLKQIISKLKFIESIYVRINRTISNENKVLDSASKKLKELRDKINRLDKEIRSQINSLSSKYKDIMKSENYVIRDGRFVLPISTSLKASIEGVIHDVSDSGQTTFIEPTSIVNLENEKHLTSLLERDEVNRILKELTNECLKYEDDLINNNRIIGQLDFLEAKAKFSLEFNCNIPEISNKQEIKLLGARHPLLNQDNVVPNDFILDEEHPMMLISGPNAGGKTIALKTVATLIYMSKLGLPLLIEEGSKIGFFKKIYIDIGDNQSIESNLSTFSAHISTISVILKYISSRDLVVIDELGNGTDPKEGDALSVAIVKYLLSKKCISLISSHYPLLKKYGLSNNKIVNASFVFNEDKMEPTFKMLFGVSGKSYAFLIGQKFGLPFDVIKEAKNIYTKNYQSKVDVKIDYLDNKERELIRKENELNLRLKKASDLSKSLDEKETALKEKELNLKNKKIEELDNIIDNKIDEINDIYNDFLENKEKGIKEIETKLNALSLREKTDEVLNIGDFVEVKALGASGQITRINGNKISFTSDGGFSLNTTKDHVVKIPTPKEKLHQSRNIDQEIAHDKIVSTSLNLIGLHIDEAVPILEKYIDDCVIKKYKEVRIIHGYGTGQLKRAIHESLRHNVNVKSFELGGDYDGGTGSTIVYLK